MGRDGRLRVVVVDDQPMFRDVARDFLTARGYEVIAEAGCAASALEAVERHQPDAMLLDIELGDDDGFTVCSAVTRIHPDLAVVMTSAEKNYELMPERIQCVGARGFVRKEHLPRTDFDRLWQSA